MATQCKCRSWQQVRFSDNITLLLRGETSDDCSLHVQQELEQDLRELQNN